MRSRIILFLVLPVFFVLSACTSASGSADLTQADLSALLDDPEVKLRDQTALSEELTLVEAQHDGSSNCFFFYNCKNSFLDVIPTSPEFVELKEIVNDRYIILRTTGENSENVIAQFPEDLHCFYVGEPGTADAVTLIRVPSRLALDTPVSSGSARNSRLTAFTLTSDGLDLLFTQETAPAAPDIPPCSLSWQEDARTLLLMLQSCTLDPSVLWNQELLPLHPYLSSVDFQAEGDTLYFRLVLDETAQFYTIQKQQTDQASGCAVSIHFFRGTES